MIFDRINSAIGYQYFIAADGMPAECRYLRTRLQIEYSRLLDWCEVAGIVEYENGQDLPDRLKADRFVLIAVLTEMRTAMEDLADINGKYVELQPDTDTMTKASGSGLGIVDDFSSLSLSYERRASERRYPRGLNHIVRSTAMARDIMKNPKRLLWVTFDKDVFVVLLGRLAELNDYLCAMLRGHQARELELATQRTFLEMVQVRTSVEELKLLVEAALLLQERKVEGPATSAISPSNERVLASLADFKSLKAANDVPSEQKASTYVSVIAATQLSYSNVHYQGQKAQSNTRIRTEGILNSADNVQHQIWVEWKTYKVKHNHRLNKQVPLKDNVKRIRELVALLKAQKANEFIAPRCLGYFDDRDDMDRSEHDFRFGLVFEIPAGNSPPVSLHQLITSSISKKPSFTDRVSLAYKVARGVLYLHAVNWLHKALRSDSVLFFFPKEQRESIMEPYLTGYEYARPDQDGGTTTGGDINEWWEPYVHPNYQGSAAKGTFRKTFDIYSLGIILLEISCWQPIEDIVGINPDVATANELKGIRSRLLGPDAEYLTRVKTDHGDRYHTALKSCIEGRPAFGIGQDENENSIETGVKLQREFARLVVDTLEGINI